jgi:hypothetical protein
LELLLDKPEKDDAIQEVYLVTMARVLAAQLADGREYKDLSIVSRADIGNATVSSFNTPLPPGISGGRPRQTQDKVLLVVVFREQHADESFHFHVVVKLQGKMRFKSAKRTLREQFLSPSHFSCSHSLLWSALR